MDDSDLNASSTPLRHRPTTSGTEFSIDSDSDSDNSPPNGNAVSHGIEIPASDPEDDCESPTNASSSSDDFIANTPVARNVPKPKQNLLRKSLGFKSAIEENFSDSSQYMSFQSVSPSPVKKNSGNVSNNSSEISPISKADPSNHIDADIETLHSNDFNVSAADSTKHSVNTTEDDNATSLIDSDADSIEHSVNTTEDNCATHLIDSSADSIEHSVNTTEDNCATRLIDESVCSNGLNSSAAHSNVESVYSNDGNGSAVELNQNGHGSLLSNGTTLHDFGGEVSRNLSSSNGGTPHEDKESIFLGSPKRSSLIDLTQSDSSLQNSPAGARRDPCLMQRDLADIVAELSAINQEIEVKKTLLESIKIETLPDHGRNLTMKISELKRRKIDLEKEQEENTEYAAQKATIEQMRSNLEQKLLGAKQSTLNFQQTVKKEPKWLESSDEGSPVSVKSFNADTTKPNWGDLPNPDMTISGFGKRAMQTHMAEKSLTLEALSNLHNALKTCPSEDTYADDPKYLRVELMPHQKHGLAWMLWREQERPPGGILADDMGLGKTLSMISLILKDFEKKETSDDSESSDDDSPKWLSSKHSRMPKGGTLVVCPASLVAQWENEIYKRVKKRKLSVELYHGQKRETNPRRLAKNDVVVTTYNLVSRESGVDTPANATRMKDKGPLFIVKWERIILDEAHMVRNHKSQMALGVCELVGKHRWCLTGTPIQNKELDLYALLKFLQCSPFDDLTVWKKWVDNKNAAGMERLKTMMKSLMLRRTKQQLQESGDLNCLPEKCSEKIDVSLDPEELALYEKVALYSSTLFAEFLSQRAEKQQVLDARYGMSTRPVWEQEDGPDNQFTTTKELANMHRKMKGISEIKTHQILVLLLRLRQVCCHPGLVKKMLEETDLVDLNGGAVEDQSGLDVDLFHKMNNLNINNSDVEKEDAEEEEDDLLNKSGTFTVESPILSFDRPSAKIRAVLDVVQDKIMDTDDKAIIVSQWPTVLKILAPFLKQMQIKFDILSGDVPVHKRQEIVNAINKSGSGPQILLLSLTAGGVGLNLVGANHLLLMDIHWNPQLEAQACDRIYRVGQKKTVHTYRFITENTIEERILALQERKLALANHVLTGTKSSEASKLTLADLQLLFSAPKPVQPVPPQPEVLPL